MLTFPFRHVLLHVHDVRRPVVVGKLMDERVVVGFPHREAVRRTVTIQESQVSLRRLARAVGEVSREVVEDVPAACVFVRHQPRRQK